MTYTDVIDEYARILRRKQQRGIIGNGKCQRLIAKLDEWEDVYYELEMAD